MPHNNLQLVTSVYCFKPQ